MSYFCFCFMWYFCVISRSVVKYFNVIFSRLSSTSEGEERAYFVAIDYT